MPYTEDGKGVMLYAIAQAISHVSLHSGPPPRGNNEFSTGVYRRKQIEFIDPKDGSVRTQREIEFELPQGSRVTHAGFWTASIGGILLAWEKTTEHNFRGRGIYIVDLAKLNIFDMEIGASR